jgi:hypothetical protein
MAKITPETTEPGFERINNPEVERTLPQQLETNELMEHLQGGVVVEQPKPIAQYLEQPPKPEVERFSDETQKFVDRFKNATPIEAVKIMNEVLLNKKIPPDELTILIQKGQEAESQHELPKAA